MLLMDGEAILDRMVSAVEKVRQRLLKATDSLERSNIDYAVAGGNAVAAWVARVDEAAVRNTQDVDILIRRADLAKVKVALEQDGFVYHNANGMNFFLDGVNAKARDAVHLIFSGEKLRSDEALPNPDVSQSVSLLR